MAINETIILIPILASFLVTFLLIPAWIKKAKEIKLIWTDMNKFEKPMVAGSGGVMATLGFVIGVFIFIAYEVFYQNTNENLVKIFALLLVVVLASGIGLIDDLLGWRKGGLSRRSRILLLIFVAIPLVAINAGRSIIDIPGFGPINLGIFYPLLVIPIGVAGATSVYNFLAGYNGLEAGQGIILFSGLGMLCIFTGSPWLAVISFCMAGSLIAFIFYNYYPARVFPGDSLTYAIGSCIAVISVFGDFEKVAIFFFTPYIIETILKLRGKLVKYSFGKPNKDGSLELMYNKIYGLEHLAIYLLKKTGIKPTEKKVVWVIWLFQIAVIAITFFIFRGGIFKP